LSIWFLLWLVLAFILLGSTAWSAIILFQQKKAWKAYAEKKGLSFTHGTTFGPCEMEGIVDGYTLSFFTAVQQKSDSRKNRQVTVFQVDSHKPFVDGIACGTKEMNAFLQSLEALSPHDVKSSKWNKTYMIRSRNKKAVDAFLTDERAAILSSILSMPNADVIILLNNEIGTFRFETSNPLTEVEKIDSLINKLITKLNKLVPSEEEAGRLAELAKQQDDEPRAESTEEEKKAAPPESIASKNESGDQKPSKEYSSAGKADKPETD
jgi:hypothetical protein